MKKRKVNPLKKLWHFSICDQTTWKYIDVNIPYNLDNKSAEWILNPTFAYQHCDPNYPEDYQLYK